MFERLGSNSMFYVPAAILTIQLGLTVWLESRPEWPPGLA